MSEAGNSMNFQKKTICGILKLDKNKVHNIYHKRLAKNILLKRSRIEQTRINGWTVEDCKIIMSYMCDKYSSMVRTLTERREKSI